MSELNAGQQTSTVMVSTAARQQQREGELEIDLGELFLRLIDKWYIIVACALIGVLISFVWTSFFIVPQYQASTKLYILNSSNSAINLSDLQIGSQLANDCTQVFHNWVVHQKVKDQIGLSYTLRQMENMIRVSILSGTRLLEITVTSPDRDEAKLMADTYAQIGREFIAETMKTEMPTIFQPARTGVQSSPNRTRNLIVGFLVGALLASAVIVIDFIRDDKVRTSDDVTKLLGLPTLGVVTMQSGMSSDPGRNYKGARK